jgi:hypothetical protein
MHDEPTTDFSESAAPRKRRLDAVTRFAPDEHAETPQPRVNPWALQHYFDGEIDLIKELASRFPQIPVMSLIHIRQVGTQTRRGVATLATQDGAASVIVEIDAPSQALQFTFALSSMLALRFTLGKLSVLDREQWIEAMRRESGEPAFLWNEERWGGSYIVGAAQKNFTHIFAFSPQNIEAAARLTPEVTRRLVDWLEFYWNDALTP